MEKKILIKRISRLLDIYYTFSINKFVKRKIESRPRGPPLMCCRNKSGHFENGSLDVY